MNLGNPLSMQEMRLHPTGVNAKARLNNSNWEYNMTYDLSTLILCVFMTFPSMNMRIINIDTYKEVLITTVCAWTLFHFT